MSIELLLVRHVGCLVLVVRLDFESSGGEDLFFFSFGETSSRICSSVKVRGIIEIKQDFYTQSTMAARRHSC